MLVVWYAIYSEEKNLQTCGPNLKLKVLKANVKGPAITYTDLTSKLCSYVSISDKYNTKDQLIQVAVGLTTGTESNLEAIQFLTPPTLSDLIGCKIVVASMLSEYKKIRKECNAHYEIVAMASPAL